MLEGFAHPLLIFDESHHPHGAVAPGTMHSQRGFELTERQIRLIEKANPCFKERHVESAYPGQMLYQDTFYVSRLKGAGRVYQQAVDTYGSFGFAKLYTSKRPETAGMFFMTGCCRFIGSIDGPSRPFSPTTARSTKAVR